MRLKNEDASVKSRLHALEMSLRARLLGQFSADSDITRFPPYYNNNTGVYVKSGALFYPISKNASSTAHLLLLYADGYIGREELQNPDFKVYSLLDRLRRTVWKPRRLVSRREKKSLIKFSFVRNPYERLVSFYANRINPPDAQFLERRMKPFHPDINFQAMEFSDLAHFVSELPERLMNRHFLPQHYFFTPKKMDFVGRVENFSRDMERFASMLKPQAAKKIAEAGALRLNASERHHYTEYYDEKTRRLAEKIYARDIKLFGYRFGD